MCLLIRCPCLFLAASWIPNVFVDVYEIILTSAQRNLKVHYTNNCSHKGMEVQCIYSIANHDDNRFRNDIRKTALMGIVSFLVPSRDVHSLFWVP